MSFLNFSNIEFLILIGFLSIILEIFVLSGIGILFLGIGAFATAGIIYFYPALDQYSYFLLGFLSIVSAILLWKPLKNWNNKNATSRNIDIIGSKVKIIESDLEPNKIGKAEWSGTIMNAKLDPKVTSSVKIGSHCIVIDVKGNVLVVEKYKE